MLGLSALCCHLSIEFKAEVIKKFIIFVMFFKLFFGSKVESDVQSLGYLTGPPDSTLIDYFAIVLRRFQAYLYDFLQSRKDV